MRSELAHTLASIPPALCYPLRKQVVNHLQGDPTHRPEKKRATLILDNYIHSMYQSRAEDEHSSLQKVMSEALKQHVLGPVSPAKRRRALYGVVVRSPTRVVISSRTSRKLRSKRTRFV